MVCGTGSDVGKSHVVAGLCRLLARRGVRVAPFKAQNMALNSFVTSSGHEIARAQGVQALAARVEPEVAMNPVLLKPTGERTSQVVVMGRAVAHMDSVGYLGLKRSLLPRVLGCLEELRSRFDVVICEGAGSPAEINLADHDIVNLAVARRAGLPVVVVGDIDRGGVFASLYGTFALLSERDRALVKAFVINKLRGDPAVLGAGPSELERRCGVPTAGVLPFLRDVAIDAEDSLALSSRPRPAGRALADELDVAVVCFPRLSNFTDLDALEIEPGVSVRLVGSPGELGDPDLVVLPGTKSTVADLDWVRGRELDHAVVSLAGADGGPLVLGICGGYQMLGRRIVDQVESGRGAVGGLGLLDARTAFAAEKIVRQRRGRALGHRVEGYEIHHGVCSRGPAAQPWVHLDDGYGAEDEGARDASGRVMGTSLHGALESDGFRRAFLAEVGRARGKRFEPARVSFSAARDAQFDRLADAIEANLDMTLLDEIIAQGAVGAGVTG